MNRTGCAARKPDVQLCRPGLATKAKTHAPLPSIAWILLVTLHVVLTWTIPARAQETAAEEAERRRAALSYLPKDAARRLFGTVTAPAPGQAKVFGEYWKGCQTGGVQMPATGAHWQVMRLSRNRSWGQPVLIEFLQKFAASAASETGWSGILIGDMSQPRGGPMLTGHASHQLGIEADIWLRPMPEHPFTAQQIEEVRSTDLLREDRKDVDPKIYTKQHFKILRAAARDPAVARVFVNAAIKKALCRDAGDDRSWLHKVRPIAGHTYHFHIRMACPKGQTDCIDQIPPVSGEGCAKADLDYWFAPGILHPKTGGPGRQMSMAAMPKACRAIVGAPAASTKKASKKK